MLDNNHHKSSCAFAEQVISYLYDEANAAEKTAFDVHLNSCSNCAGELASFGFVRSSIVEWKNTEFSNLTIPLIEIPYPTPISTEKESRITALRRIFAISPAWSTAFAVVIICAGAVFLQLDFSKNNEVANDNKKSAETIIMPVIEKRAEQPVVETKTETAIQAQMYEQPKPLETKTHTASKNQIIKASNASPANRRNRQNSNNPANVRIINENDGVIAERIQSVPQLNSIEEEDDDSLRLADLFADDEGS